MNFFNKSFYFKETDAYWYGRITIPTVDGVAVLIQYLHKKYQTNISHVIKHYSVFRDDQYPQVQFLETAGEDDFCWIKPYLAKAPRQPGPWRQAFLIWLGSRHARFMAYIRDSGKECFLYSDSLGGYPGNLEVLHEKTGIPVYVTSSQRQTDDYSCVTDALVFSRDITGKRPETGEYIIPNLAEVLESRKQAVIQTGVYRVHLPETLLKSAQKSSFIADNQGDLSKIISKGLSLAEFLARYRIQEDINSTKGTTISAIHGYLFAKGKKYERIMQIQYYLNEIEWIIQQPLTSAQKREFILKAKTILQQNAEDRDAILFDAATAFAQTVSPSVSMSMPIATPEMVLESAAFIEIAKAANYLCSMAEDVLLVHLSKKYNLEHAEWVCYLKELILSVQSLFGKDIKRSILNMEQAWKFEDQLIVHPMGLAAMDYLLTRQSPMLRNAIHFFSRLVEKAVKQSHKDFRFVHLLLQHPCWIISLCNNKELCHFGNMDAWYAKKILDCYPELLNPTERDVLIWTAEFKSYQSFFSDLLDPAPDSTAVLSSPSSQCFFMPPPDSSTDCISYAPVEQLING
ncbi:hypothetical protein ELY21_05810 [Legionella sp. km535]|uniref:hypothetical protein n=1 Tax=Legionella sp. km535 TaxID=2498107 RepID=UPI000F8DB9B8|nr:hypothetical protein [Legionella sp. km535]RUR19040.1 hypothetical protein ELY21_05810 [Legionella sp. km535]